MSRRTSRPLVVTLGLAAALTLAGCAGSAGSTGEMDGMGHGGSATAPSTSASSGRGDASRMGDVMFAQMMIPHHEQAVEMADQALAKGASAPVAGLAREIKAAQGPEIATMQGWLREWGAPAMSGGGHEGHGGGMMSDADMDSLSAAQGDAFEQMWLTMMIEHHEGAVVMAQDVLETTKNPEVETLARAVVSAQNEEIATMKALL